jgi:hypothetical protein
MGLFGKKEIANLKEKLRIKELEVSTLKEDVTNLNVELNKFSPIKSIAEQIEVVSIVLQSKNKELSDLEVKYNGGLDYYNNLQEDLDLYKNQLEIMSYGIYEPVYDFDTSEKYKEEIDKIKIEQKELIKNGSAYSFYENWTINGSLAQGKAQTKRDIKLLLRGFNGESFNLISKVKWNNINSIKQRIEKSFTFFNKISEKSGNEIRDIYKDAVIKELHLTHEFHNKKHEEKEEQRDIRARLREEEKLLKDVEVATKKADKEEALYQKALDKVKKELGVANEDEVQSLNLKIEDLNNKLSEVLMVKERALSMAQQTRAGHVYIISNIGSFGEDVFKIGLTRRLEPLDRIRELSGASVPFKFDIHLMVFSEDAPQLEKDLHHTFRDFSLNKINFRKEFFKLKLDDIALVLKVEHDIDAEVITIPEAKEYRETKLINQDVLETVEMPESKYKDKLFD